MNAFLAVMGMAMVFCSVLSIVSRRTMARNMAATLPPGSWLAQGVRYPVLGAILYGALAVAFFALALFMDDPLAMPLRRLADVVAPFMLSPFGWAPAAVVVVASLLSVAAWQVVLLIRDQERQHQTRAAGSSQPNARTVRVRVVVATATGVVGISVAVVTGIGIAGQIS